LIQGLDTATDVKLIFDAPARLPSLLDRGDVQVALVPVIDLTGPGRNWKIVSDACIGCDGETLTVRVFSRIDPGEIGRLHVDGDSHTSVALAQVIWREMFGRTLDVLPWTDNETVEECEAILLIGDKVVTRKPIEYEIETDLGASWKSLTGLPFVFAVWAAPRGLDTSQIGRRLSAARDAGVKCAHVIAEDVGPGMGWPVMIARRYLTSRLNFKLTPRHREGMRRFLELAGKYDIAPTVEELMFA